MNLVVNVTGATWGEVRAEARKRGAAWFEVDARCIGTSTREVEEEVTVVGNVREDVTYRAQIETFVEHAWNRPTTGFPKCNNCGISHYQ